MATVREVAQELGLSERTVQRWIGALRQHLNGAIRQEGRRVILDEDAVALLRQIRQLRDSGMTFNQAVGKVLGINQTDGFFKTNATIKPVAGLSQRQSRHCDVVDVVIAVSCAVGALSLVAIAIALWLK